MKKLLSVFLALAVIASCMVFSASAAGTTTMRFGSDHKFKIVVFADTQDNDNPNEDMIDFMGFALDIEQPDMVVFTGDNVVVSGESKFRTGAGKLLQPLIERNIPYAYTFGNHDAEYQSGSQTNYTKILQSKEFMHSVYMNLGTCLTYNADSSIYGYGNCNVPIYASDSNDVAFNLWIIDSNMYSSFGIGKYDYVHQDQLDWFVRADQALEAQEGHKVNSLVFQHIVVPEVYNCLVESSSGSKTYNGKKYKQELNSNAHGYLGEFPCPPESNSGEFTTFKNRGDVLGIVTGHDHSNSFVGTYQGIDFIQMPGMTFYSYGDDNARGYGVIELDETDTSTYNSYTVRYNQRLERQLSEHNETVPEGYSHVDYGQTYISEIRCAEAKSASDAKNSLSSLGYTVIDYDLNKGAGGQYIYMGYKTTPDYAMAIKDLRFYSGASDYSAMTVKIKINGKDCIYNKDGTDLNKGSGGDYIFACTTRNAIAGKAITGISFAADTGSGNGVCGGIISPSQPADLNRNTGTHRQYIYCFASRAYTEPIDISEVKNVYLQLQPYLSDSSFSDSTMSPFRNQMSFVSAFLNYMEIERVTTFTESDFVSMVFDMKETCAGLCRADVHNGLIYGIPRTMSEEELAAKFNIDFADVSVRKSGSNMGTGSSVTVSYENSLFSYKTVMFGDVNGDGWYDGTDATIVSSIAGGLLSREAVGEAVYAAADCNHDGSIDGDDVELLNQAGVLLAEVNQTESEEELMTNAAYVEYLNLIDQNPVQSEPAVQVQPAGFLSAVTSAFRAFMEKISAFFGYIVSKIPCLSFINR